MPNLGAKTFCIRIVRLGINLSRATTRFLGFIGPRLRFQQIRQIIANYGHPGFAVAEGCIEALRATNSIAISAIHLGACSQTVMASR